MNNNVIENVVVFNEADDRLFAVSKEDFENDCFENIETIKRAADLKNLIPFKLVGVEKFLSKHPDSLLQKYIEAEHINSEENTLTLHTAAYIHLYRYYKSFNTLISESYTEFIDSFIDSCIEEDTDHPATICYSNYETYKIFKLRKSVFTMYKKYLNDYEFYRELLRLQNLYNLKDDYFRKKKELIITHINGVIADKTSVKSKNEEEKPCNDAASDSRAA